MICYYWVMYICSDARMGAKGGVRGEPTMVRPGAVKRACCYGGWPLGAGPGYKLMALVQGL
jgi:hypothetical protein